MQNHSAHPLAIWRSLLLHHALILKLTSREISARYKGSVLGIAWSVIQPLCALLVYTFVFSVIFKARWGGGSDSKAEFALILFAGLLVFNFFSECVSKAPAIILANQSYVKKIVFPLEILVVVNTVTALFGALISLMIWSIFHTYLLGPPPTTALALPLIFMPFVMLALGVSWFLASLGVFIRDIAHALTLLITLLLFLSPVFYPTSALPQQFQHLIQFNPLSFVIEQARNLLIWNIWPSFTDLAIYWAACFVLMCMGFAWFQRTRKGFADVV
jgi:lipopolysaccharide transport system permease protein